MPRVNRQDGSPEEAGQGSIRTLERALSVLELLGGADEGMSLSAIVERTRLPMATSHRILRALINRGYVEQDLRTKRYELGFQVLQLRGSVINQAMRMASEMHSFLVELSADTRLKAHLAIYRAGNIVYIDSVAGYRDGSLNIPLGMQAPAYSTGLGKVLLAYEPEDEVDALLRMSERRKLTPNTIVDADELRTELRLTRERGYSVDHGEIRPDRSCIAAPIFDYRDQAIAALSVAGLLEDVTERTSELVPKVLAAAQAASSHLGYRGMPRPVSSVAE